VAASAADEAEAPADRRLFALGCETGQSQ